MDLNNFKELRKELEKISKNNPNVQWVRKKLPYKIPKGFMSWEQLSLSIGWAIDAVVDGSYQYFDDVIMFYNHRLCLWFRDSFPLYLLGSDLLTAFDNTDVLDKPNCLSKLVFPFSLMLLLPPLGMIKNGNYSINHILIAAYDMDDLKVKIKDEKTFDFYRSQNVKKLVSWLALDTGGYSFACGRGIKQDGSWFDSGRVEGSLVLSEEDYQLLERINNIVLQSLLTIVYKPDLIGQEQGKGFAIGGTPKRKKGKEEKPSIIYPRWIGKDYKIKVARQTINAGLGTPKRTHWRSGHWREQPYGPRENPQYRQKFIEPILINPPN